DALPMQTVLQHGERLLCMVCYQTRTLELFPIEALRSSARSQKEPIALVDLGEMNWNVADALRKRIPARRNRRLHDVDLAVAKHVVLIPLRRLLKICGIESLIFQEPACNRRNEGTVEHRMPVDHDTQLCFRHLRILPAERDYRDERARRALVSGSPDGVSG